MRRAVLVRAFVALAALGACGAGCGSESDSLFNAGTTGDHPEPPFSPAAGGMRRLLGRQYVNSIRLLLGDKAANAAKPPPNEPLHGFDAIGAAELSYPTTTIADLEQSANAVAAAAVSDGAQLGNYLTCVPSGPSDSACHKTFIQNLGHVAWRRPLESEEIDRLTAVAADAASKYSDFNAGLAYAISAVIQSPYFLYIIELGQPSADAPAMRQLTPSELATRMSFALLDETPDAATLTQVEQNGLPDADHIRELGRTMLAKPEARTTLEAFYAEIFKLRDLLDEGTVPKDGKLFPNFTPTLRQALVDETLQLIDALVWDEEADFRDLLTADYAYVNAESAAFYGMPAPTSSGYVKTPLPVEQKRSGLLGSASYLARWGHPTATSPTRRGLFVRNMVLCETVDPPPPNVNQMLPTDPPDKPTTLKEKLEQHRSDPACAGCHARMDPIGLALENYDAVGAYRTLDNGLPIDTNMTEPDIGSYSSAAELGTILHDDDRVPTCIIKNIFRNSLGHMESDGEQVIIDELGQSFASTGYKLQDLLVELVASRAFQFVGEPK